MGHERIIPVWYKPRHYPHFDRPLSPDAAIALVGNPARIARHAFLPFISFEIASYRYKRSEGKVVKKQRPVAFASHADAQIYSFYADLLRLRYEAELTRMGISECVLAYRRFKPAKCNIHFAHEAFEEISERGACTVVALDLEKFFDTIDHDLLKDLWGKLLGVARLPPDHYAVFRSVTKWSSIDQEKLYTALGIGTRKRQTIKSPLTTAKRFRELRDSNGLLEVHGASGLGIPQGSPISAVLSNIFMIDVDEQMYRRAKALGASYRRYSDDVMLIGEQSAVALLASELDSILKAKRLSINADKTLTSRFSAPSHGVQSVDIPCQYLGFTFDGRSILIRSQTLAKFWHRMLRGIKGARRAALASADRGGRRRLFRRELYARYSHLGATPEMLRNPRFKNLRNSFLRYAKRSSIQLGSPKVLKQLRKHWSRLNAEIKKADEE